MDDVTFLIPVKIDSPQRLRNVELSVKYVASLGVRVFVLEQDTTSKIPAKMFAGFPNVDLRFQENPIWNKSRCFNYMMENVDTKYVTFLDADVVVLKEQLESGLRLVQHGIVDIVYPSDHEVMLRTTVVDSLVKKHGTDAVYHLHTHPVALRRTKRSNNYGFCMITRADAYFIAGADNEEFVGWGAEDMERHYRLVDIHGLRYIRGCGTVVHMNHPRLPMNRKNGHRMNELYELKRAAYVAWVNQQPATQHLRAAWETKHAEFADDLEPTVIVSSR